MDECVYIKCLANELCDHYLHVDDMLIFRTWINTLNGIQYFLDSNFDMKEIGEAKVTLAVKS